jgi:hypothetical protein
MIRLQSIRKSKFAKIAALTLAFEMTMQGLAPIKAFALTTGPSQPEMLSFEPIGTSEMVNVFSGDFTYNIPLMDVGGYPINLSYNSGITTDQEASWTGLGWNINPGAINRSMRGLPDDFDGDLVTKRFNMKTNRTYSASVSGGVEAFGFDPQNLNYGVTMSYNNYTGVGYEQTLNMTFTSGKGGKGPLTGGLGITSGTEGLDLRPSVSFATKVEDKEKKYVKGTSSIGISMNSRSGLKALSLSASVTEQSVGVDRVNKEGKAGKEKYITSSNGGSSISFASPTYSPQVSMPMVNTSFTVSFKPGADFFGADGTLNLTGSYSEQKLEHTTQQSPAYGYLNSQDGMNNDYALHDFNREKDGAFTENTPSLPLTNYTYDVYSVNGQGIGGMYRPYRSDLGYVYDARNTTTSFSGNLGLEAAVGNLVHGGTDISITDVNTTSKRWTDDNAAAPYLAFHAKNDDMTGSSPEPLYEPFYFKEAGEKSVDSDPGLYSAIGGDQPIRVSLHHTPSTLNVDATANYRLNAGSDVALPSLNYRSARQRRNQVITTLSVAEARKYGLQKSFYSSGISPDAKDHHIGEITTLRSDGSRYVFGIPAYNNLQQETSFNVQGRTPCYQKGLVTYSAGDNSVSNTLGIDNYFSETETPAYAHSFLLTAVLSPDYVDYDNIEGPSAGDLGSYTRINYVKAASSFKWRTPLDGSAYSANFNEGLKSDPADDKASYVYGEKEIWYVSSIETKSYVAVFSLSDRNDGLGVTGKDGTINSATGSRLKKLDKITLYSKPDYAANGTNATPVKVVNFEYDYSLCPGIPNSSNSGGKLTLTKVYFTYGKSYKAKLSGYTFKYADLNHDGTQDVNYSYNQKASDRWGNYIPNPVSNCSTYVAGSTPLSPWEYPYVDQDRPATGFSNETKYTAAWSLTDIDLPSGGTISVDYESDDYAFVQDQRATQMFKVIDFRVDQNSTPITQSDPLALNTSGTIQSADLSIPVSTLQHYGGDNYYLYFKLQTDLPITTSSDDLLHDYLGNKTSDIYFRFLTDITNSGDYEYVSGYFDITGSSDIGLVTGTAYRDGSGNSQYGWIRLKTVAIGDRENTSTPYVNPICKCAWQFGRLQMPRKVWGEPDPQSSGVEQVVTAIANSSMAQNLIDFFKGPNRVIRDKGYGRTAIMNKSWIRMNNPDGTKYGGGSRVKRVGIKDNWSRSVITDNLGSVDLTASGTLPSGYDAMYGQEYTYTTTDPENSEKIISSGVASYEPQQGGDENPFHQPVYFSEQKRLVPDDESYIEKPYGESFFPSPGVGYSKVTVKSLSNSPENGNGNVTRHNTGYTVQEFYTAYDFPTITRVGWLDVQHWRTNPILSLLRITMKDYLTASQGFVVELNDMHGKPKAVTVYEQGKTTPLSQVKYFYKTNPANAKQLDNSVSAIGKDGEVRTATCGLDYDFVADFREQNTKVVSSGVHMNVAGFLAGIIPAVVPTMMPSWNSEDTRFRSAGTTKVINRSGILVRTEATDAGGTATTENLAWDEATGELLLTKTYTDFNDAVYNFSYPAHWAYDRMGQAYKNAGASFSKVSITAGDATLANADQYFVNGDEVMVSNGTNYGKAWVCSATSTDLYLTDISGGVALIPSGSTCSLKILRSGRRNMQAVAIGSVVTKTNPIKDINSDGINDLYFENVLNANSTEFAEQWSVAPGKSSTSGSGCSLTDLGSEFAGMLNNLAEHGRLTLSTTLLSAGTYSYGYTDSLNAALTSPSSMVWSPTGGSTQSLSCSFTGDDESLCSFSLVLPVGYAWNDVISISNIVPTSTTAFTGTATLNTGSGLVMVTFTGEEKCFDLGNCTSTSTCGVQAEQQVNPYFHNILGNWRSLRSYLYLANRTQPVAGGTYANIDLRNAGVYDTKDLSTGSSIAYQPFWLPNSGNDWTKDPTYWTWSQEVTMFTPFGNEVENKDALGRYSSAVFGYNNTLPIAVASNARHQDIGFDGFEDYSFITQDCRQLHFSFYDSGIQPDATQAHTGLYSMKVVPSTAVSMTRNFCPTLPSAPTPSCPYTISAGDLNTVFSPYTGSVSHTFVLNYWVKEATASGAAVFNYANSPVNIYFGTTLQTLTLVQKSDVIEGWQQYQYTFSIPAGQSGTIKVELKNNSSTNNAWFDDIRIMPFDASMTTYVYHPINQRLTQQLDENNYATIYEYDEEGALIRVKKETERGIVTIKESRNNSYHQ